MFSAGKWHFTSRCGAGSDPAHCGADMSGGPRGFKACRECGEWWEVEDGAASPPKWLNVREEGKRVAGERKKRKNWKRKIINKMGFGICANRGERECGHGWWRSSLVVMEEEDGKTQRFPSPPQPGPPRGAEEGLCQSPLLISRL